MTPSDLVAFLRSIWYGVMSSLKHLVWSDELTPAFGRKNLGLASDRGKKHVGVATGCSKDRGIVNGASGRGKGIVGVNIGRDNVGVGACSLSTSKGRDIVGVNASSVVSDRGNVTNLLLQVLSPR
ncbi:hypothetical protein SCA6_014385 [Theobroma cacao]